MGKAVHSWIKLFIHEESHTHMDKLYTHGKRHTHMDKAVHI